MSSILHNLDKRKFSPLFRVQHNPAVDHVKAPFRQKALATTHKL